MPRGKSPNIADVKRIVYLQLLDYTAMLKLQMNSV